MCGFIGILNENGITGADISDTAAMSNVIRHRGPDLNRGWDCGRVCFGFRRLSIIDLEGGAQPYVTPDGRYACVYNGEELLGSALCSRKYLYQSRSCFVEAVRSKIALH